MAEQQPFPDWIEKYRAALMPSRRRKITFKFGRRSIRSLLLTLAVTLAATLVALAGSVLILGNIYKAPQPAKMVEQEISRKLLI